MRLQIKNFKTALWALGDSENEVPVCITLLHENIFYSIWLSKNVFYSNFRCKTHTRSFMPNAKQPNLFYMFGFTAATSLLDSFNVDLRESSRLWRYVSGFCVKMTSIVYTSLQQSVSILNVVVIFFSSSFVSIFLLAVKCRIFCKTIQENPVSLLIQRWSAHSA